MGSLPGVRNHHVTIRTRHWRKPCCGDYYYILLELLGLFQRLRYYPERSLESFRSNGIDKPHLRHLGVSFCIGQGVVHHLTDIPTKSNRKGSLTAFLFSSQQSSEAKRHILHHTALFSVLGQAFVISPGNLSSPPTVSQPPRVRCFRISTTVPLTTRLVPGRAFWAHQHTTGQGLFRITGGLRFDFQHFSLFFPGFPFRQR